jgi:hypothetical protein
MEIKTGTLSPAVLTGLQYLAAGLGAWLLHQGYITQDQAGEVFGVLVFLTGAITGVVKSILNRKKLVQAAVTNPNRVVLK